MSKPTTKDEKMSDVTKLDFNCLKSLIEDEPASLKGK